MEEDTTLRETLAIVIGKIANKIPMSNEKEKFCEKMITEWCKNFGLTI